MNLSFNTPMNKALALTRSGNLVKATILLQGILNNDVMADSFHGTEASNRPSVKQPWNAAYKVQPFKEFKIPGLHTGPVSEGIILEGGKFLTKSYRNTAGMRNYKLYVPESYSGQSVPLIVMLHGCTQSPDDFANGTRMNRLAEENGFLVAYPEQPMSANSSRCWNWFKPGDQQRGKGEPSLIAGITQQIMQDYPIDANRVYVAGLSAGGAAAVIMGNAYPDLYAAVGVHSGLACGAAKDLPSALAAMKQGAANTACDSSRNVLPTIVFHGDKDHTVNPKNGEQILAQSELNTASKKVTEQGQTGGYRFSRTTYKNTEGRETHEQWLIHGAGHAWSGGSTNGSYTDAKGPDASKEMLRFFLAHTR